MQVLIPEFLNVDNGAGAEPVPDGTHQSIPLIIGALIMNGQNESIKVTPGSTYRFHVVNIGAFAFFHLWIEGHKMTVIEVDGIDVKPYDTEAVDIAVGQRYSVLVTMNADKSKNYPLVGAMGKLFLPD
jgi:iron transport multicopper oxidase